MKLGFVQSGRYKSSLFLLHIDPVLPASFTVDAVFSPEYFGNFVKYQVAVVMLIYVWVLWFGLLVYKFVSVPMSCGFITINL